MRLEGFMATKSFMILGKRYQSDFSHTDPACQFQQQWTKWWWDRFTHDCSDVREHEAWMIYEQWCLLVQGLWLRVGIQISKELIICPFSPSKWALRTLEDLAFKNILGLSVSFCGQCL